MGRTSVVKKAKRKEQHRGAITSYKNWLKRNPQAKRKERVSQFDTFVDSSALEEITDGEDQKSISRSNA